MNRRQLSRREFLRASACAAAGLCLGACAGAPAAPASANYYVANKTRIIQDLDPILRQMRKLTAQSHGEALAAAVASETMAEFERLLPQLPYIGGDRNTLTDTLIHSTGALAFYRVMKTHSQPVQEIGRLLYRTIESMALQSSTLSGLNGQMAGSKAPQNQFKRMAEASQKRLYPDDWVLAFVEGDGKTFDFGVDYTECGLCKFNHAQDADELTPFLCLGDFPVSQVYDTGLVRTTTIARGGSRCDFRFKGGRPIQMEWTPDFLKE
jgi:hypothetical protein